MEKRIFVGSLVTLCLLATLALAYSLPDPPPLDSLGDVIVESAFATEGDITVVSITIGNVSDLGYAGMILTFNESVVNVTEISGSDFESSPNIHTRGPGWVLLEGGQYEKGLEGTVRLCNVTLYAIGEGEDMMNLNLADVALDDMVMKPIAFEVINGSITPSATTVRIGSAIVGEGATAVVPITIGNVSNLGYAGVILAFNESVVNVTEVSGLDFDSSPNIHTRGPGWVFLEGGQSEKGLEGTVRLCNVALHAVGERGDVSLLNLTDVALDDMEMKPITVDDIIGGSFTII